MAPPRHSSSSNNSNNRRGGGTVLPDIPESPPSPPTPPQAPLVTPGPNAFAQEAALVKQHRLRSNAFYQQQQQKAEMQKRFDPPTARHPAHRSDFDIESSARDFAPMASPTSPRRNFLPEQSSQEKPTLRGYNEDQREQTTQQHSTGDAEHTPVYKYTPKNRATEFGKSTVQDTPKKKRIGFLDPTTASSDAAKSPKKGFFGKLGFQSSRTTPLNASAASAPERSYSGGEALPPKPKAILGSSSQSHIPIRTPSKKNRMPNFESLKSSFSRKPVNSDPVIGNPFGFNTDISVKRREDPADTAPNTATTSVSEPTYEVRMSGQRTVSLNNQQQSGNDSKSEGACGVGRLQSLQYFDRTMPPTPPAKNTPPHEKEEKQKTSDAHERSRMIMAQHMHSSEQRMKNAQRNLTPSKGTTEQKVTTPKQEMRQLSHSKTNSPIRPKGFGTYTPIDDDAMLMGDEDGRTSPTKFGTVGHRNVPTLVKQPSLYSIKALMYPDLGEEHSYDEVKRVADEFGLEGLTKVPDDYYRVEDPRVVYSPSVYSNAGANESPEFSKNTPVFPPSFERSHPSNASLQTVKGLSSKGKLPVAYPNIPSTPSKKGPLHHKSASEQLLPAHGPAHSPDHSISSSRTSFTNLYSGLVGGLDLSNVSPRNYDDHPSARVSPLRPGETLGAATYMQPTPLRGRQQSTSPVSPSGGLDTGKTLTPSRSRTRIEDFKHTGSPVSRNARNSNFFPNAPDLPPNIQRSVSNTINDDVLYFTPVKATRQHASGSMGIPYKTACRQTQQQEPKPEPKPKTSRPAALDELEIIKARLRQMENQQEEIARLRSENQTLNSLLTARPDSALSAGKTEVASPPAPTNLATEQSEIMKTMFRRIESQQEEMFQLRNDLQSILHTSSSTPLQPSSSAPNPESSPATSTQPTMPQQPSPVELEGSLAQMGLHHRVSQHRVDVNFTAREEAEARRHLRAFDASQQKRAGQAEGSERPAAALDLDQVIRFLGDLRRQDEK
ncbi:hypothetical protein Q7P37_008172 [Cladosporium fusiforme]